jgi:uncharacterized membrane protein YbhN (UPF0104 family)
MKSWFKYSVYVSLLFLLIGLTQSNFFIVPEVYSIFDLIISFVLLFSSFIVGAICWKEILRKNHYHIQSRECLASVGLTVFAKYLPGKILTIIGRAVYVGEKHSLPVHQLSSISLDAQLITLWLGLMFGALGVFLLGGVRIWGWLILILWVGLTVIIFCQLPRSSAEYLIKKILKKTVTLPRLATKSVFAVLPWFIFYWTLSSVSFYMLVNSLTSIDVPLGVGLGFPLAGSLGVMAFIVPGGLGVREGAIIAYLSLVDISVPVATTISIASRLWYLVGEVFIFFVGWMADRINGWPKTEKLPQPVSKHLGL